MIIGIILAMVLIIIACKRNVELLSELLSLLSIVLIVYILIII